MWKLLVVCLFALKGAYSESCQNGDVRLAGTYLFNATDRTIGRLEVYFDGQWGTVCDVFSFNRGAAQSVCHQLGYYNYVIYNTVKDMAVSVANDSTPVLFSEVDCDYSFDNEGNPHILRCKYTKETLSCDHIYDTAIRCDSDRLDDSFPYKTQVRLLGGDCSSSGELGVFVNKTWGSACFNGFTKAAADSACRQLGYTNAVTFTGRPAKWSKVTWIGSTTCSNSQPCLNQCFGYPSVPVQCPDDKVVFLNCTFDVSNKDLYTAGNETACRYTGVPSVDYFKALYIGIACGAVGLVLIVCFFIMLVIVLVVCLSRRRNVRYVTVTSSDEYEKPI